MKLHVMVAAVILWAIPALASAQAAQPAKPTQGAWPRTVVQQGRYFSYPVPTGWVSHESTNGVDASTPDENEGYSFVWLEGTPGNATIRHQLDLILSVNHNTNIRWVSTTPRPAQNGFETAEYIFTCTNSRGRAVTGWAWTALNNSFGRNNAYTAIAWAPSESWDMESQFLVASSRLVNITNVQQAFRRDELIRSNVSAGPGSAGGFNHPNTFTPYSNQAAMDRISAQRAVTNRGVTPLVDPSTGKNYIGSWDTYNHVQGGWVNPQNPTQLLQVVRPPGGN